MGPPRPRSAAIPAWGRPCARAFQSRPKPPRQLDVEGVEVDVADVLEELGGPGVGQGLGQTVSPGLVFLLQGPELGQGRDPPRRPRPRPGRSPLLDRDAGGAAFPEAALALGVGQTHDAIVSVTVTGPITGLMDHLFD